MHTLKLIGAYGRTYPTRIEASRDWAQGKDFKIIMGPYTSVRDKDELKRRHEHATIIVAQGEPLQLW